MIKYLKHKEINKTRWDEAIDNAFNGIIYAKSWYLDIVSPHWDALVSDDYRAVMPLTWRKKYGVHYLYQPFFTQQLGLFAAPLPPEGGYKAAQIDEVKDFLNAIPKKFKFIEIQLDHQNTESANNHQLSTVNCQLSTRITHHLNLNQPYQNIKSGYSENLSRNIKRAEKNNLQFVDDFEADALISLFRSTKGASLKELSNRDYITFKKLMVAVAEHSVEIKLAPLISVERSLLIKTGARMDGKLVAAAVFFRSNHEYIFLFSATDEKAKETGAMSSIIDRFIQQHVGENMKIDFEGSMDAGVSRFYHSFGAEEVVYLQIRINRLPLMLRWLKG